MRIVHLANRLLLSASLVAAAVPATSNAMVLAINEGATYRVADADVQ